MLRKLIHSKKIDLTLNDPRFEFSEVGLGMTVVQPSPLHPDAAILTTRRLENE